MNQIVRRVTVALLLGLGWVYTSSARADDETHYVCQNTECPTASDWSSPCGKLESDGRVEFFYGVLSGHLNDDNSTDLTFDVSDHHDCDDASLSCAFTITNNSGDYEFLASTDQANAYHFDDEIDAIWLRCACGEIP